MESMPKIAPPGAALPAGAVADHPRRWLILAVMSLATLIVQVDQSGMTIALPGLRRSLGASIGQLQWVMDAYSLALAALVLTAGAVSDRLGRKRVFLAGIAVFGLASIAGALAGDVGGVIAARAVLGVGAAMFMPGTLSILTQAFAEATRARAIGIWGAVTSLGVVIGPVLGGTLLQFFDWRAIFVMNLVVAAAAFLATAVIVPESRDPHPRRLDLLGALLSAAGLLALTYGIIGSSSRDSAVLSIVSVAVGCLLLAGFWLRARRRPGGLFDVTIARTRSFRAAALAAASMMFVMTGLLFVLTQQLQLAQRYPALLTGLAVLPLAAAAFVSSMLAPALAARTSPRLSMVTGLLLFAAATAVYALAQPISGYLPVLATLVLVGLGIGLVGAVANDVLMSSGPRERSGLISAMNDTVQEVGAALGVAVVGAVLAGRVGGSAGGAEVGAGFAGGSAAAVLVAGGVAVVGAVAVGVLLRRR